MPALTRVTEMALPPPRSVLSAEAIAAASPAPWVYVIGVVGPSTLPVTVSVSVRVKLVTLAVTMIVCTVGSAALP